MVTHPRITEILDSGLCVKCGGCVGACPNSALEISFDHRSGFYEVTHDAEHCSGCSICENVCPAISFMDNAASKSVSDFIGPRRRVILSCSSTPKVRFDASSGGVGVQLLSYLLKNGLVDEVYAVRSLNTCPFAQLTVVRDPADFETKTREFSSRYVSVPVADKIEAPKGARVAVVCVPCQAHAVRKLAKARGMDCLIVGIACSGGQSAKATERCLEEFGIVTPTTVMYRGGGWPGRVRMEGLSRSGGRVVVDEPYLSSRFLTICNSRLYQNPACWKCDDHFAESADVSLFDFWDPCAIKNESNGLSGVIVRSKAAEGIITDLISKGEIRVIRELEWSEVMKGQESQIKIKKCRHFMKKLGVPSRLLELIIILQSRVFVKMTRCPFSLIVGFSWAFTVLSGRAKYVERDRTLE